MIVLLLASLSHAVEPPWVDAYAAAVVEAPSRGIGGSAGGGVGLGEAPFYLEARVDAATLSSGSRLALWPAARAHLRDVDAPGWRPSLVGALGVQLGTGPGDRAVLMGGLDVDVPAGEGWTRPRLGLWAEGTLQGTVRGGLRIGVVHRSGRRRVLRSRATPLVVDKAQVLADIAAAREGGESGPTAPEKARPALGGDPGGSGPWWDPEVCAWVEQDPGHGWRPVDGAGALARGEGMDGAGVSAGGSVEGTAGGPVRQGWLVVVAQPGDIVRLPGLEQSVGEEGAARLRAPEGVVDVEVVGGGRTQTFEAAIADGYVLWLRADPPDEVAVQFAVGSAAVDEADRVAAQALARNRGQFRLRLTGSFSPEGDRAFNLDLARRRAQAVAGLLREVGVPAAEIEVLEPVLPRAGLTAAEQRAVYIEPVAPGEAP